MSPEEEFEKWYASEQYSPVSLKAACKQAFLAGYHQGLTRAAEIEKDAERFRFLISQNPEWMIQQKDEIGEHWAVKIGWHTTKRYNSLVELIDAAILTERDKGD